VKVPKKIIYQMRLQIMNKNLRIVALQREIEQLENSLKEMQPIEKEA
jgi:Tfp pilus assembly protein PilN